MHIAAVNSKQDLKQFIELPYRFYRSDPLWVAPLKNEVRAQFNPRKNPTLQHCDYQLFLLKEGQQVLGRVAAFIDHLAIDYWREEIGLFGYYECPPDENAARQLLDAARIWLQARQMKKMRGPWSFVSQE